MLTTSRCFILILLTITAGACAPVPDSEVYDSEGIISIPKSSIEFDQSWQNTGRIISSPMRLHGAGSSSISTNIYIQNPGYYTLWILSGRLESVNSDSAIHITVTNNEGFLTQQGIFHLPTISSRYLEWKRLSSGEIENIRFERAGFYNVRLAFSNQDGFLLEKLHFSRNDAKQPSGFGLPSTAEPDLDPILLKRQQPVMIPPAWAFGLMVWPNNDQEVAIETLLAEEIWVDAVLHPSNYNQLKIDPTTEGIYQHQIFSAKILDNSGEKFIPDGIEFSEERPFMLSGMQNIDQPDFKRLPAKWVNLLLEPSSGIAASEALKQRIEMVADPKRPTTEAPFISSGVDDIVIKALNGDIPEEILIRWIQFSALTGMMHLYMPTQSSSEPFSVDVLQEIREMTQLRSRLFPYLYSLAHLVRARAENPVRGDGNHEVQFKLGEAFLVAPVYREGDHNRSVWFPEGTWYNYWSGERFDGGQTWLVEASVNEIPLFVKAGSIIPYRSRAGQIMEGSNRELTIEIYAGGVGTFRLYEDDGVTNRYRNGEVATTGFRYFETDEYATFTIGRTVGEYTGQPEERSLILRFLHIEKPDQVIANSNKLQEGGGEAEWMYDEGEQLLTIHWNHPTELKTDFEIRFSIQGQ